MVKNTKIEQLNRSFDEHFVAGSTRGFVQDSLPEAHPPSEGGDFNSRFGRQRQHRPMGTPVSPEIAALPYRRPSIKIDPRALNLQGSGAVCG